ncbi:MAG: PAS domain S-box protein, partial [Terriglobia bacterium]
MKILIADDEKATRLIVSAALRKAGHQVVEAEDGETAWHILRQPDAPKLAVLDWILPKMEGVEVIRKFRAAFATDPFYVILLTSLNDKRDLVRGLEAGADDYLCKPFDPDELRARVQVGARMLQLQSALAQRVFELERAITARQRAEKALMKEQYYLRSLMDCLPDAIYFKDTSSRFVRVSQGHARKRGLADPSQALGKTDHDFFTEEHASQAFEDEQQIMRTREPIVEKEEKETWPDGKVTWVSSTKMPLLAPDGEVVGTFGVSRDITERRRAEAERLLLTTAVEQAADTIVVTDADGRIEYVNPAFTRMTGYTSDEAVGRTPRLLKSGKQDPEYYRDLWKTILSGQAWRGEVVNRRKDGTLCTEEMTITPVRDSSGVITNFIAVKQDVTERRQEEEALRRSETKFRSLYQSTADAVMLLDAKGFLDCNKTTLAMFGCATVEDFCARHPADLSPPMQPCGTDSLTLANQRIATAMQKGSNHFEWVHKRTDTGETFPADVLLSAMELDGKSVLQAVVRDITERKRAEEATRFLASIVETSDDAIIGKALDGTILSWNKGAELIYGYRAEEVIGKPILILCPPDRSDEVPAMLARIKQGQNISHYEAVRIRQDGRPIDVSLTVSPMKNTAGEVVGAATIAHDITERKRAEEALRASESRYRLLFETNVAAIFRDTMDGRIVDCNVAAARTLGYESPQAMLGLNIRDMYWDPEDRVKLISRLPAEKTVAGVEVKFRHKGGRPIWLILNLSLTPPDDNGETLVQGTLVDITERKRAEEALAGERNLLRTLIDNVPDLIFVKDAQSRMVINNVAHRRLLGAGSEDDAKGKTDFDFFSPELAAQYYADEQAVILSGRPLINREETTVDRDGNSRSLLTTKVPWSDRDGKIAGIVGMSHDITELKRAGESLQRAEEQVRLLLDSTAEGIYGINLEAKCTICNPACLRMLGYQQPADLLQQDMHRLAHYQRADGSPYPAKECPILGTVRYGRSEHVADELFWRADGTSFPAEYWAHPIRRGSELVGAVITFVDITERKRTETALAEGAKLTDLRAEVGVALTRGGTLRSGLQECAEALVRHAGAAFARIWTLNEASAILVMEASAGIYTHIDGPHGRVPVGSFKIGHIAQSRTPHLSNDVQNDPEVGDHAWAQREGLVSFAGHPLLVENKVVGVVAAFGQRPFSDATLLAFASVANQIAQFVHGKRAEEALQRSEAYLAESQRLSRVGSWAWNVATRELVYWSPEHYRIFGFDAEKGPVSFATALERVHPEDRRVVSKVVAGIVHEQRDFEWDFRLLLPDGSIKYIHGTGHPVVNERSDMVELVGTHADVTERKRVEARLTAQYQAALALAESGTLVEATPRILQAVCEPLGWDHAVLWAVDRKANVLRWAGSWHKPSVDLAELESAQRQITFSPGSGLAGSVWATRQPSWIPDISPLPGLIRLAAKRGLHAALTFPIVAGGEVLSVMQLFSREAVPPDEQALQMLKTIGGQIGPLIERQRAQDEVGRAQEALQRSEERARLLFATIPHPAYVVDLDTLEFLEVNDAAVERYGYSRDEFLRMTVARIRPAEEQERLKEYVQQIRSTYRGTGEWRHRTKDGRVLDVEVSLHTFDYGGRRAAVVIAQDVTARKQLEVELRHSQKLEAVGGLASGIAHELNTPIQFVGDNTHFLQDAFRDLDRVLEKYRQVRDAAASGAVPPALLDEVAQAEAAADLDYLQQEIPKALEQSLDGVTRVATIVRAMKEFAHPDRSEKMATDLNKS